ncbi:MAG: fibronectin type III domain-containing protein, partial [Kangiellaceae bacterium]|nr:fibronectin type III domain-containing protein [Kangiellaceae bacterium]
YERKQGTSSWSSVSTSTSGSYTTSKPNDNENWEYYSRACNTSSACADSSVVTQEIVPSPTQAPTFNNTNFSSSGNSTSITLSWNSVSGATSYKLEEFNTTTSQWETKQNNGSLSRTAVYYLGSYDMRLSACNGAGCFLGGTETIVVSLPSNISGDNPSRETFTLVVGGIGDRLDVRENNTDIITKQDTTLTGNQFTLTRDPGTYTYQARMCTHLGGSSYNCNGWGANFELTVKGKPNTPASISSNSTQITDSSVTINWTAPSSTTNREVDDYELQHQINSGTWSTKYTGTLLSYSESNLTDSTYRYRIRACNTVAGDRSCSSYQTSSNIEVNSPPTSPTSITAPSTVNSPSATVSWSGSTGTATYYQVQNRQVGTSWPATSVNTQVTTTSATISNLTEGDWEFRVRACNEFDWACSGYGTSGTTTVNLPPTNVTTTTGSAVSKNTEYTVTYSATGTVTSWTLYERKLGTTGWETVSTSTSGEFKNTKSVGGETWEYYSRACNTSSACTDSSVVSQEIIEDAPTQAPSFTQTNFNSSGNSTSITLNWNDVSSASTYKLEEFNTTLNDWEEKQNNGSLSYSAVYYLGSYDMRLSACNDGGCYTGETTKIVVSLPSNISGANPARETFTLTVGGIGDRLDVRENNVDIITKQDTTLTGNQFTLTRAVGIYTYQARMCTHLGGSSYNCNGWGAEFALTVKGKPNTPASISSDSTQVTDASATINWTAPSATTNREVDEYELQHQ